MGSYHRLAALGDNRNDEEYYLAPYEARPIFLAVLLDSSSGRSALSSTAKSEVNSPRSEPKIRNR